MSSPANKRAPKKRWPWIIGGIFLLIGLWHVLSDHYREEEKELRSRLRESVIETFPDQEAKFRETFGLVPFEAGREVLKEPARRRKTVVLVHGLDDPGKVWQNLAPALVEEEFGVWQMHYPNDQPIVASARLFFKELTGLEKLGIRRISIVAHSMGGLVSRELLTRPGIGYARAAEGGQVPEVASLVMVGTPNHGSQLVRFRFFAEIRDQLTRLTNGEGSWLGAVLDGAGEAKIDLLPGSRFLAELNARPHPAGVEQLIIAGIASPWKGDDINRWLGRLGQNMPDELQEEVDAFGQTMISMTHGLGDGLVTVESTRLSGISHRTVDGTHLSMIRNITQGSVRIPPAVPIIVNRLKAKGP